VPKILGGAVIGRALRHVAVVSQSGGVRRERFPPRQVHPRGEFYGEFGTFDVAIDVPSQYVVAATGAVVSGDAGWITTGPATPAPEAGRLQPAGRKTVHFHAENVHDFAWCADPDFVVQDSTWNDTKVRVFYRKQHEQDWRDTTLVTRCGDRMALEEDRPLSIPSGECGRCAQRRGDGIPDAGHERYVSESLVLHEVGHIYFYGALANDERNEAWLDEGFATFLSAWY